MNNKFIFIIIVWVVLYADFASAQVQGNPSLFVERSKSIATFYVLLNQEHSPTVIQASTIFHIETEWLVAQDEYQDSLQAYYQHINEDEESQPSLLFKRLREIKDLLQFGTSDPYKSPRFSILQYEERKNALKVVFPSDNGAVEVVFTFARYPEGYRTIITDIILTCDKSVIELIKAR